MNARYSYWDGKKWTDNLSDSEASQRSPEIFAAAIKGHGGLNPSVTIAVETCSKRDVMKQHIRFQFNREIDEEEE